MEAVLEQGFLQEAAVSPQTPNDEVSLAHNSHRCQAPERLWACWGLECSMVCWLEDGLVGQELRMAMMASMDEQEVGPELLAPLVAQTPQILQAPRIAHNPQVALVVPRWE